MTADAVRQIKVGATHMTRADCRTVYELVAYSPGYVDWGGIGSFEEIKQGRESRYGVGSERVFRTAGMRIYEEVVADTPERHVAYRLISGLPLKNYLGQVDIARDGDVTRVDWYSTFEAPAGFGWFWRMFMQSILSTMSKKLVQEAEKRVASRS
tara:strand:+ start:11753 stop:12214 length:462 start_codon:yes stop_codon:yes gene_type:complete